MESINGKKQKIQSIVNVFETGSIKGGYGNISIYKDGLNFTVKQITYGKSQTTEYGKLKDLIKLYVDKCGIHSSYFKQYIDIIGKKSLCENKEFIIKLREAGNDPVMIESQDLFFDEHYWEPAMKFCNTSKFETPLGGLVIYDSYIHSGSILSFLRNRFAEKVPAAGGSEQKWVEDYLTVRKKWLENHTIPILRKTVYRVNNMLASVSAKDWELIKPFNANGVSVP